MPKISDADMAEMITVKYERDQLMSLLSALCKAVRDQDDVLDETPELRRALLDAESWTRRNR